MRPEPAEVHPRVPSASEGPRASLHSLVHRFMSFGRLDEEAAGGTLWPLFLVSFASLYIEVMLIRWMGTEVGVFAYFQNLTLIACFLGFGLGCYKAGQ
ncbi:MAG TPA: hypothetical protein VGS20_03210, partial [Candidatus Acidoferrales bacterium]|nr:hypothetical protein [Candidatus Acidoferrales bacterium]